MAIRILTYLHARRTMGNITGVGQHMLNMILGLARLPGVEQVLLASGPEVRQRAEVDPDWPLQNLPMRTFPLSRGLMQRIWWATHFPRAEHWYKEADWVYAPADAYVPTSKARYAVTIHDIEVFEEDLPWYTPEERRRGQRNWGMRLKPMLAHAAVILTVSEFSKQRMVQLLGVDPGRIAVVGNGIDPAVFNETVSPDPEYAGSPPYLLTIGGITSRKGGDALIELARRLQERKSAVRILVAGKSQPHYAEQARELANIVQLGYVPAERLPGLLRGALALLFLSRYEGFGIPIIEAFACGTPAIISSYSSLPEVGGDAAIVAEAARPEETIEYISRLMDDSAYRRERVELGRRIVQRFTWDACVQRLLQALK
ncbi:MAG TPA: glycosyltransferase family 1 protein [Tepidisphaeraceae bacterium]|nr:glycosyltransferase family 1 protein [Tepidisphaeraceae bacterium]